MNMNVTGLGLAPQVDAAPRKPRLALMGEFSAGKSTLANLLTGTRHLPEQVTATQLPPVWMSHGDEAPYRVDLNRREIPISLDRLADVPVAETLYVRMHLPSGILADCDLIDMPGISDPNMPASSWQRVMPMADGVIWCTHATQAWRQSESAVWASLSPELRRHSLLLLTRMDKIVEERDRVRILRRVDHETEDLFFDRLPISLTRALTGRDDPEVWRSSGAEAFEAVLTDIIKGLTARIANPDQRPAAPMARPDRARMPAPAAPAAAAPTEPEAPRVLPRRITRGKSATPRPAHVPDAAERAAFLAMMRGDGG